MKKRKQWEASLENNRKEDVLNYIQNSLKKGEKIDLDIIQEYNKYYTKKKVKKTKLSRPPVKKVATKNTVVKKTTEAPPKKVTGRNAKRRVTKSDDQTG